RFFWPAFSPVLLNLAMIGTILLGAGALEQRGIHPAWVLPIGVVLGGVLQFVSQLIPLRRIDRLTRPRLERHPEVAKVARLLGPSVIGLGIYQIDILLSRLFASLLPEGAVTYLYYAMRLVELPQAVFIMAIAAAALPDLSTARAHDDPEEMKRTWRSALSMSSFVIAPSLAVLTVLAVPVVAVLLQRGRFDYAMTGNTAAALAWVALGMPGVAGVRNTSPFFYALQDTRTPVKISAVTLVAYVGLCLALMWPFGHVGIAAAIGAGGTLQFLLQLVLLRRKVGPLGLRAIVGQSFRHLGAALVAAAAAWGVAGLGRWEDGSTWANAGILAVAILAAGGAYLGAALALGAPDAQALLAGLGRRLAGARGNRTSTGDDPPDQGG
ncbi:MAG: lipid II flippase MurJ, partial [Actinomycetota bacterium]